MADYPVGLDRPGYVYEPNIPMSAYNNAKATGSFTVARAETTTVSGNLIREGDVVVITPSNLKAAQLIAGAGGTVLGISVLSVSDGSFVLDHDDDAAAAGATFFYSVLRNF